MSACIPWEGARRADGYGTIGGHGLAHRQAWEAAHGPIPAGAVVHHECENPSCVNVDHLRLVESQSAHARLHDHITTAQRVAREQARAKTHCIRGHEFTKANTYWTKRGRRACRACHAWWAREYRARGYLKNAEQAQ